MKHEKECTLYKEIEELHIIHPELQELFNAYKKKYWIKEIITWKLQKTP